MIRQAIAGTEQGEHAHRPQATEHAADDHATDGHDDRASWLEPYDGSRGWRGLTWGAILALHARYPHVLSSLKEGWWRNTTTWRP
ncbi:MAG TPA: hypothetical protein VHU13_00640 [Solirubrobacteraceae bacterium]|jgi:hypothetical protein|nr:hypothetical protein [Solirubrobacteraceae bacterium]